MQSSLERLRVAWLRVAAQDEAQHETPAAVFAVHGHPRIEARLHTLMGAFALAWEMA